MKFTITFSIGVLVAIALIITLNSFNPRFQYLPAMIGMALGATVVLIAMHFSLLNYFADQKVRDRRYKYYQRELEYLLKRLNNLDDRLPCSNCRISEEPDKEKQAEEIVVEK